MANAADPNATPVSVGITATLISGPGGPRRSVKVKPVTGPVYFGPSTVTASGAAQGYPVATNTADDLPVADGGSVYGIASATVTVNVFVGYST